MRYRVVLSLLVASSLVACTEDAAPRTPLPDPTPVDPIPMTTGEYEGHYRVPVADPALEAAARFPVPHVDWTVAGGVATLHYDLPVGLVGGVLDVTLTGAIAAGDRQVTLTGTDGTGVCVAAGTVITCHEQFTGLGALPISMRVVEQQAALEYAGPAADRTTVATLFDWDPIGIVDFDLTRPAPDDNGGDDSP